MKVSFASVVNLRLSSLGLVRILDIVFLPKKRTESTLLRASRIASSIKSTKWILPTIHSGVQNVKKDSYLLSFEKAV